MITRLPGATSPPNRINIPLCFMKAIGFAALAFFLVFTELSVRPSEPVSTPRLAGIISLPDRSCAVLRLTAAPRSPARWFILSAGQRDGDLEVLGIAADKGKADLRWAESDSGTIGLRNATNLPFPGVVLEDVGLDVLLTLFGQFTNRSLLRWPELPTVTFNLRASASNQATAARALAGALVDKGLFIIPDGDKFLMVVPESEAANIKPHAPLTQPLTGGGNEVRAAARPDPAVEGKAVLAPGMIDFRGADVRQVASIYSVLTGREPDLGDGPMLGRTITFHSQTPLTKGEAVYALETLLGWSGAKLAPMSDDNLKR